LESPVFNVYRGVPVAIFRETTMQALIQPIAQSQLLLRERATKAARLGRMSRIDSSNFDTGAFCLESKYLEKLRPACIVSGHGKIQRANHAFDIQVFVRDLAEPIHQIKSRLVVKIFPLVGDVLVKLRKGFHGFPAIRSAFFLSRYRALKPSKLLLRLSVVLGWFHFLSVRVDKERLQAKINSDFGIIRGGNFNFFQLTGENDEPAVSLFSEGDCLDFSFDRPVKFKFHILDTLKPSLIVAGEFGSVSDSELHGIESPVAFESRVSRLLSCFEAAKERLKSSIEPSQRSLTGCTVRFGELIFDFSRLSELLALIRESNRAPFGLIDNLSLFQCRVVQNPMRLQKREHLLFLLLRGIGSEFVRPVHDRLTSCTTNHWIKSGKEVRGIFGLNPEPSHRCAAHRVTDRDALPMAGAPRTMSCQLKQTVPCI
jgi:hypothetical protein